MVFRSAMFIIDPKREHIAIKEATRLGIKIVAITDTNCDPDPIDFVIPGNDDALRSIRFYCKSFAETIIESRGVVEVAEKTADKTQDAGFALFVCQDFNRLKSHGNATPL